jgi:hypothetical protein
VRAGGLALSLAALGASVLAAVGSVGGCESITQHKPQATDLPKTPAPSPAAFAAAHNARVATLGSLWSSTTVRIQGTDADGQRVDEQVDGRLFVERPSNLHLRISKLGEPYFMLGSNAREFWWFDLSKDDRPAYTGLHESATREQVRRFGLPVHPLDLLELLAVTPITEADLTGAGVAVKWVSPTDAEIDLPARWGRKRLRFNASSFEATGVTLTDAAGKSAVRSELSQFDPIPTLVGNGEGSRIEHHVELHLAEQAAPGEATPRLTVILDLVFEAKKINPSLFDLEAQKKQQNIRTVHPLDPGGAKR